MRGHSCSAILAGRPKRSRYSRASLALDSASRKAFCCTCTFARGTSRKGFSGRKRNDSLPNRRAAGKSFRSMAAFAAISSRRVKGLRPFGATTLSISCANTPEVARILRQKSSSSMRRWSSDSDAIVYNASPEPVTRLLPRFLSFLCLNAALCWGGACDLAEIAGDIDRGNLSAAEAKLKAVEAAGQRCDEWLLQAGRLKFAQADFTRAEDLFSRFVNAAPKDARGYYQIALVALVKGDYQRADNLSSLALSYQPEYAEALVVHGRLLAMKGQTAEALAALQRACALKPQDAEGHFQLGALFDRQKRYSEAVG